LEKKGWKKFDRVQVKLLKRFFSGKYLHEITPKEIKQFIKKRRSEISVATKKKIADATLNRHLAFLKILFNEAIQQDKFHKKYNQFQAVF